MCEFGDCLCMIRDSVITINSVSNSPACFGLANLLFAISFDRSFPSSSDSSSSGLGLNPGAQLIG